MKERNIRLPGRSDGLRVIATLRRHFADHAQTARHRHVGLAIPARLREALGLDDEPSWVIVSEHNVDEWLTPAWRRCRGRPGVFSYGFIPPRLFAQVKAKFLELYGKGQTRGVRR